MYGSFQGNGLPDPLSNVPLRMKKSVQQKSWRKSSGYYSPVASVYGSPSQSQRSSLVLDSTGRVSTYSSDYNSPVDSERSSLQLDEEDEYEQKQASLSLTKGLQTHCTDASQSSSISDPSQSPLISNQTLAFTQQKSTESSH